MNHQKSELDLVIVTGLSGAGLSTAIDGLQDLGFYCIDNLPVKMIGAAKEWMLANAKQRKFALGMDIRTREFAEQFKEIKNALKGTFNLEVIFLTANNRILETRYSTTRRKHPVGEKTALGAAIVKERELLEPLEYLADVVFDTSSWSPHHLVRSLEQRYFGDVRRKLLVTITSFGFKYGQITQADSLFDVRFIENPYFVDDLRGKNGRDAEIIEFIENDKRAFEFRSRLLDLFRFLLPNHYKEGKNYFRIGIGCTGGQHRSVYFAEKLAEDLLKSFEDDAFFEVERVHRDLGSSGA